MSWHAIIILIEHFRNAHKLLRLDPRLLATTSADQTASIWRTTDFSLCQKLKYSGGQRWVWDCAFTNDSKYLITGEYLESYLVPISRPVTVNVSPCTASSDNLARLWRIETGEVEQEYQGHQKAVTALAFADSSASL